MGIDEVEEAEPPMLRLYDYWKNAEVMHRHFIELMEQYDGQLDAMIAEGQHWRFGAYLGFWLTSLYVVVEGFNKLGLKEPTVQRLFNAHLHDLKAMRHEMCHFQLSEAARGRDIINNMGWAEELHVAIGRYIDEHARAEFKRQKKQATRAAKI